MHVLKLQTNKFTKPKFREPNGMNAPSKLFIRYKSTKDAVIK